jgi:large subunit ribosomal protein L3
MVVKTDVDRGLVMIKGAVPGSKGGWVMIRDAVKRARPNDAPVPGSFRMPAGSQAAQSSTDDAPAAAPESSEE